MEKLTRSLNGLQDNAEVVSVKIQDESNLSEDSETSLDELDEVVNSL